MTKTPPGAFILFQNHLRIQIPCFFTCPILEEMNKTSKENFTANTIARSMAIEHWKSMYNAQKHYSALIEQQVDVVNEHWKKEYIKVSDELFDLKYTTNAVSK